MKVYIKPDKNIMNLLQKAYLDEKKCLFFVFEKKNIYIYIHIYIYIFGKLQIKKIIKFF